MKSEQPLRYWIELDGASYPVREVRGFEAVSEPFRLEARFALEEARQMDPESLVGSDVALQLVRAAAVRTIHGVVTDISVGATTPGAPEVIVVLEPRFALTRLRQDIRLFREKTVPEIVTEVLQGHGIRPTLRLSGSYARLHYCVQFRETDFAFVSRLLEDEGIFYFFAEDGSMVLGDSTGAYDEIAGGPRIPFRAASSLDEDDDAVTELGERALMLPGEVTLRDFNPEHPSLDMDAQASGPTAAGPEWYEYPGEYAEPDEGARKAKLVAESFSCAASRHVGRSTSGRLLPGATFQLAECPSGLEEGAYVITRLDHDWSFDRGGFVVELEARHGDVTYRPPRVTPAATITNPVTAVVTGPAGEDIYTDEWGRVKVHFHWDRQFPYDDTCSWWVPVLQDNTGQSGSIPRIGWEMLVHFLEGDPDRPVAVGRVYNPNDPPHTPLPENKTRSMIRSLSSPREAARDDSGTNEILFEDLAGQEVIQFHAQKDQNVVVAHDKTETILVHQKSRIHRDEQIQVGNDQKVTVDGDIRPTVRGNQIWFTAGNRDLTVSKGLQCSVGGNHSLTIGGMHMRRIAQTDSSGANISLTETVGGVILEASLKTNDAEGTKASALLVGGVHVEVAKQDKNETAGMARLETIGGVLMVKAGGEVGLRATKSRSTTVGGALRASSVKEMAVVACEKLETVSATASFDGPEGVTFKVGDSTLVLKDGIIGVEGKSEIKLTISAGNNQGSGEASQI
jgi:type VI secretion system secreted protein VgrG